jgi:hypothetical protein
MSKELKIVLIANTLLSSNLLIYSDFIKTERIIDSFYDENIFKKLII